VRAHQVIIRPVVGVVKRIAPLAAGAEEHVLGMRFKVVLGVMAFRLDMASPVLTGTSALVGHAVPDAWVKYLSRHTLPIMQGYVRILSVLCQETRSAVISRDPTAIVEVKFRRIQPGCETWCNIYRGGIHPLVQAKR